jgi:hypothetical protein
VIRAINKYTTLKEKATGRIGNIVAFRLDLEPREVVVLVKFEGQANPVSFTGLGNILESFEIVRKVNGKYRTVNDDRYEVMLACTDVNSTRFNEMSRTVEENYNLRTKLTKGEEL